MDNWGECRLTETKDGYANYAKSKAFAEDKESYSAILKTRFDFSCSQFEVIPRAEISMTPLPRQSADSKLLPKQQCPISKYQMDCATALENDESVRPEVGDVSLCLKCGEILVYGDA